MSRKSGIRLVVEDEFTDCVMDRVKDSLAEALSDFDRIELKLDNISSADGSLIELMCSVHRVAGNLGKTFILGTPETVSAVRELAIESGYSDTPCSRKKNGCLYVKMSSKSRET